MENGQAIRKRQMNFKIPGVLRFGIKMITPQPRGVISCNELFGSFYASL